MRVMDVGRVVGLELPSAVGGEAHRRRRAAVVAVAQRDHIGWLPVNSRAERIATSFASLPLLVK